MKVLPFQLTVMPIVLPASESALRLLRLRPIAVCDQVKAFVPGEEWDLHMLRSDVVEVTLGTILRDEGE